ncbi:PD-(D/E)XK nuclease-like domain-containing protein [Flammeovirga aprica]|uniref:Putative exodeoxyribonuclease 8 PDDEXK-like domain-containing protein n=1 Tax=Flammeovirga aprica JL-4 TaxID=694437 RepID=A0A7X9RXT8_9BACT|nr:PD-(D/E)XK nuclease-like domain-containing protein [Flammeovirga aprica]NME70569.1 hypothetical protein [Flammeovirga aprica JL-4]
MKSNLKGVAVTDTVTKDTAKFVLNAHSEYRIYDMNEQEYRQHPAISNSDLSNAKRILNGEAIKKDTSAFRMGRLIHLAILEPEKWEKRKLFLPTEEKNKVEEIAHVANQNPYLKKINSTNLWQFEKVNFWVDEKTGISCKCRMDMHFGRVAIGDLKTTRQATKEAFLKDAEQYDYNRQMAFYSEGWQPDFFILIGVSKAPKSKGALFISEVDFESEMMEEGRKKMHFLLNEINTNASLLKAVYEARN